MSQQIGNRVVAPIEILAILTAAIAAAHWLGNKPGGRMVGGALLVIIIVAVLANLGMVPLASENVPVYNQLLGTAAPVSIFLLLPGIVLGSLGNLLGTYIGFMLVYALQL